MMRPQTIDGLPVYDAMEPLILEVSARDISEQARRDPEHCAMAEACKRQCHVTEARVYLSRLYMRQGDHWVRYELREAARAEVQAFDRGAGFSPGNYRIVPPRPSHAAGRRQGSDKKKTGTGRPRGYRRVTGLRPHSPLEAGAREWSKP